MSQANAIINVDINTSGAAASLRKLQTQINSFQSALNKNNVQQAASARDYSNQLSNLVNSSQFFSAETVRMRTSAGQLDETLSKGKGSIAQYFNSFRKGSAQAAQVMSLANARASALQTQFVATGAAAGGYRESLAIRPLQAFNSAAAVSGEKLAIQRAMLTQASTHMINFGKNTQWAGRQLMVGFTVPLSIFGALAGKTFMELEKQAISFKKVYGDSFTTPEELEENMKAVSKLSIEYTKYGIAASKTMELAAQAAAMGAQGATLTDAITESTKLATLGQMEQTKALETTIALQNAFGLSGEKLAKSVNFLNMVENQTVVTLQDLAEAIPRVAPVIKGLGGSVEDMAAMIAAMKEGGVSAAQGANALKSGLASLINPSNKASESLKKVGIDINQIVNSNRGDLMGTVQDFGKALSSLDKLGQQQALEKVFGKYQYARLGALFNNIIKDGTQASKVLEMTTMSAQQLQATADKELKVITDSPATKFTAALEKLKVSIAPIGEMFVKLATPIVSFISKIAEGFNNLPDFAKKFLALGTVLIGVVIPAGTMFLGLLMNLGGTLVKFTHIIGVALKGLTTGGLSGAVKAVSESLKYMSLAELDTSVASQQLAKSSEMVTSALLAQVPSATQATAAISALGREYATLAIRMQEASALGGVPFVVPGAAFNQAGRLPTQTPQVSRRLRRNKGGGIPYLNDGGNSTVPGMGNTDTVPAMLTPGEFVVNKKATSANLPLLHAINSRAPGFNSGGQIPGMQYFGFRNRQRSVQPMDNIDVPMESFFASARNSMAKKVQVQSSSKSSSLYDKLLAKYPEGTNSKVDAIRIATSLGIPVESLNLKSRGNFAFRMSDRANQEMMLGKLTRNSLLDELKFEGAHVPLERQMKSYFGPTFTLDRDIFNRIYREEIAKLPEIGINNRRFEKASRNSLTRYMIETGVPRDQRKNFIRDILQQDSVSSNLSKRELLRTLDMQGIPYRESGKDVYATVDGKEIKLGHLLGREIADLGRPKGIRPFAGAGSNIESPAGYANVHASKGGLLGRLGILRGLFSTQGGLPGATRGRAALNEEFKEISREAGMPTEKLNIQGSSTGVMKKTEKKNFFVPEIILNRGHLASAVTRGENTLHPGLMFWQTRGANQGLTSKTGLTGQQLLDDFNLIENNGLYPPSLMIAGARKLGLSSTEQEDSIKKAYAQIKEKLAKPPETFYNNESFTAMTEQILRESLEKTLFDTLYSIKTVRNSTGKSIGTKILKENQSGIIPMLNGGVIAAAANAARGARGRIPANVVEWFSRMTTSISQSNRDDMLQNIPANIRRGLSTARRRMDITRGSVDPIDGGTLKEVSSWSRGQGVGRFMESSKLFETMNNSKFQIAQTSQSMKRDIDRLKSLGPDGPHPMQTWSQFHKANGGLNLRLTPEEIQESGGVIWKANKKKLEERIRKDQEFIAGHQKIIDDLRESNIPTIYKTSVKKGERYFDVSDRIVPREDQRLNNPAASNAILEEKEVALLGARLTGKAKTRIVEREEAQARYDKAKEEIKRLRTAIFNKEMSAEKAKPLLDRLHDETENMAAFVNWGRGREVSYPNVVSKLSMGGILPQMRNIGGEIFDSTKTSGTIVPGVGNKDTVPAALTPGEFVINKKATSANMQLLRAINNGTLRGYAEGEVVTHPLTGKYTIDNGDGSFDGQYDTEDEAERAGRARPRPGRPAGGAKPRPGMGMGRGMGISMGMGTLGSAMMMAPMIPGIGENAGLSSALSIGGTALSTASIIPMLAPMLAGLGAIAVPAAIVVGALGAVGAGLYAWRKSVDDAARGAAILGANLGGAANSLGNMSKILGVESPLDRRRNLQLSVAPEQQELSNRFTQSFTEGEGKAFIDKLKTLTSEKQFSMLSDYIKVAIASGMMDRGAAEVFAKSVGSELKNVALATQGIATAKGAGVGSKAMLALAQKREETVSKNAEIQMVLNSNIPDSVNSASAAKAIAASTQIMKDFSAAQVLAEEELRNNTLSYEEYRKIVDLASEATKTWKDAIDKSNLNTDDAGATAQGSIESMILAGMSPEQIAIIQNATDVGQANKGFGAATTYQDEGKTKNIESGSFADVRLLDKVRAAGFSSPGEMVAQGNQSEYNALAKTAVEEQSAALTMTGYDPKTNTKIGTDFLQTAMEGAIAGGMDATQAFNLVKNILADPLGEAATHFTKAGHSVQSFTESLSVANAEIDIPNLSDSQKTQYEDISNSLLGGFQEQFRTYIASSTNPAVALKNFNDIAGGTGFGGRGLTGNELDKARSKFFTDQEKMGGGSIANTVQSSKAYKDALQERKTVTEYSRGGNKTYQAFDSTGVDKISNAVVNAQKSEVSESVITYAVTLNGEEVDVANKINELTLAHNELIDLPKDFILGIGLDLTNGADVESFGKISDDLKMLIPTLDALPEEARAVMVNFGVKANGKAMSPEDFAKKSVRVLKALKNLDSTKKSVKKSAIVSLLQEIKVNGKTMSKEAADSAYSDLIDKYGEKKIMNLPGDVLHKVIMIETEIQGLNEYINKLNSAIALDPGGASPEERRARNALQAKVAAAKNIQRATIASGLDGGDDSGGGGGGGEKSIAQQLKEQAKDSQEMFSNISKLQNAEGFKKFIAGPFAPEFLEYLRSQGAAGLKLIKGGLEKVKAAYANYQKSKISEGAAMAALTPATLIQESKKVALSSKYNQRLAGQGMSAEEIDAVRQYVSDEDLLYQKELEKKVKNKTITPSERKELRAYNREQKRTERDAPLISQAQKTAESITGMTTETTLLKTQLDFINEGKTPELAAAMAAAGLKAGDATENVEKYTKAYNELKAAQYAADPGKLDQEKRDNLMEIADINRQIDEINLIRPLEDQVEVQQKIIDGQEKIVRGKQQEIDVIGRGIELKQRELEPLDDQIEKLQELSDKTSEAYDNQIEALDKIYEREAQIDKLKQGQLNVAQALSRGDVAGAAQAAMAASQDIAERSRKEARSALESQKEVSTQNIQNQILEIEKQKKAINKEIEDLQMKQRVIQDDIYRIQSTLILPAENEIYNLQGQINIAAEGLAAKYNNAATAMANLVYQLRLANAEKARLDGTPTAAQESPTAVANPVVSQSGMLSTTSTKPVTVQAAAASAIKTAASAIGAKATASAAAATAAARAKDKEKAAKKKTFGGLMSYNNGGMMEGYNTGGNIGYRGSKEPPPVMMNYGGAIKKYIHGSIVPGVGMSDKVPALLTPGEFIIRKSVSETYGPMLSALNSQVFPKMNLNSSMPNLGNKDDDGSVYNYQISVSLNGSNLDPNDVANAVMQKIKMSENKGVRSNNIRG